MRLAEVAEHEAEGNSGDEPHKAVLEGGYCAAILLLSGHCLELQLKTAFILHGGGPAYLKLLGHDLERALKECRRLGFQPRFSNIEFVLNAMKPIHSRHHLSFESLDDVGRPSLALTFQAIKSLGIQISPMIEGERGVRLTLPYFDEVTARSSTAA